MKKTLGELANLMGQADVLQMRITDGKSKVGAKEHQIQENVKAISRIESLKETNKNLAADVDGMKKQISKDEADLQELYKALKENGVNIADRLKGTTIVNVG